MPDFTFTATSKIRRWTDERGLWIEQTTTVNEMDSVVLYGPIDVNSLLVVHTADGPILVMGKPIPVHRIVDERKREPKPPASEP